MSMYDDIKLNRSGLVQTNVLPRRHFKRRALCYIYVIVLPITLATASQAKAADKGLSWSNCYIASLDGVYYDSCWREKSCRDAQCRCDTTTSLCRIEDGGSCLDSDGYLGTESSQLPNEKGWLTGSSSSNDQLNRSVGVAGTDLGSMYLHEGKIYFLFGDTWMIDGSDEMRPNTVAYTEDFDASDGISLDGWVVEDGKVSAIAPIEPGIKAEDNECINVDLLRRFSRSPTHGASIDGLQFVWFEDITYWGIAPLWGECREETAFEPGYWKVIMSSTKAADDWQNPNEVRDFRYLWPGYGYDPGDADPTEGIFAQVTTARYGDDLYLWGIPEGRHGKKVALARVKANKDLIQYTQNYEYYRGNGKWSSDSGDATNVVDQDRTIGDGSVLWNPFCNSWMMFSKQEENPSAIVVRIAEEPWGTWSEPTVVVRTSTLYSPFVHEIYTENGGEVVYFLTSYWVGLNYNVQVRKATFEKF